MLDSELTLGAPEKEEGLDEVDGTKLGVPDGPSLGCSDGLVDGIADDVGCELGASESTVGAELVEGTEDTDGEDD